MKKRNLDLSDIKENDLDKTASFTDLMTRSERKNRKKEIVINDDIEDMLNERKQSTKDLSLELEKAKNEYKKEIQNEKDEEINKTQILDLTRQMKFNFEENKKENSINKKKGISILNIIGEINLLCIGYYIYLLVLTNYQANKQNYIINGSLIILLVLLFGMSVVTGKKLSKFFNILNILSIITFIVINILTILK